MRHTYYRIPNGFLNMFDKAAELKLATVFYCLTNAQSEQSINGDYVISVSQKTLAKLTGLSISTIRRTTKKLCAKGFILSQRRPTSNRRAADGSLMLDKYTYIIKYIPRDRDYFLVDRAYLRKAQGQAFEVYMLFCKLSDFYEKAFYHSLKDLCLILLLTRTELSRAIKKLEKLKLIRKCRKKTRYGDFTENSYSVCTHQQQQAEQAKRKETIIYSGNKKESAFAPATAKTDIHFSNCTDNKDCAFLIDSIIQQIKPVVKRVIEKARNFFKKFLDKGSQKNGRSNLTHLSFREKKKYLSEKK